MDDSCLYLWAHSAGGIYIAFRSTKEKYNTNQLRELGEIKKSYSLWMGLKLLVTNKYWVIVVRRDCSLILVRLVHNIGYVLRQIHLGQCESRKHYGGDRIHPRYCHFLGFGASHETNWQDEIRQSLGLLLG